MQEDSENNPLVTVVIPVHNGERYISETIDSVLNQSRINLELIIVNDGSLDASEKIISEYVAKDKRISLVNQPKSGVSSARNSGLRLARGEFISFLDADDVMLENNLAIKTGFLANKTTAFGVTSCCELIDENSRTTGIVKRGDENVSLKDVLYWKGNYITIPSGIVFKTDFLKRNGGFNTDLSNNADQEIIMRLLNTQCTFHTIPQVTWYYRKHGHNMSSDLSLMERDTLKCYRLANEHGYFTSIPFKRKCMSRMALILAFSFWRNGNDKVSSFKWMIRSFLFSPVTFTGQLLEKTLNLKNGTI